MNFNRHSNLEGKHAFLSASGYNWINYNSVNQLMDKRKSFFAQEVGTIIHAYAYKHIKYKTKLSKNDKKNLKLELLYSGIPWEVVDMYDLDLMFDNVMNYVNDAIGFKMVPEQPLYFSDNCFGTTDAIAFRKNQLRIHDLKTGVLKAHMEQLEIYAALFCLEYKFKPGEISMELRIYQNNDILIFNPSADNIGPIMDKIITFDKALTKISQED